MDVGGQDRARKGPRVVGGQLELPPSFSRDGRTFTVGSEMRPRSSTVAAEIGRRPPKLPSSPSRGPIVTTIEPRSQAHYPGPTKDRDTEERYIFPSSSHARHRHRSTGPGNGPSGGDADTLSPPGERERKYRNGYLTPGGPTGYPSTGRDATFKEIEDSYSYINAEDHFFRDVASIKESRRRSGSGKGTRPLSWTGLDAYIPHVTRDPKTGGSPTPPTKKPAGTEKEEQPPATGRGYREIKPRVSNASDAPPATTGPQPTPPPPPPGPTPGPTPGPPSHSPLRTANSPRRSTSHRHPVSLHQEIKPKRPDLDDDKDKRYKIKRDVNGNVIVGGKPEPPRRDPLRSVSNQPPAGRERGYSNTRPPAESVLSGSGLGTAGLASGYSKEPVEITPRSSPRTNNDQPGGPSSSTRPAPKHYAPGIVDDGYLSDSGGGSGSRPRYGYKAPLTRETERRPREISPVSSDAIHAEISPRHADFAVITPRDPKAVPSSSSSPLRSRTPPQPTSSPEPLTPKGILKQPTQKFPESNKSIREGVAPLKDNAPKGVPSHARWTKVSRKLVSPSALKGNERFEAWDDYVIILRVLSKEEIDKYAVLTAKIRAGIGRTSDRRSRDEAERYSYSYGSDYYDGDSTDSPRR